MRSCIVEVRPAFVIEAGAGSLLAPGTWPAVTCSEPALVGTEVCKAHKYEIFGGFVETYRVEKTDGIALLWQVRYGLTYRKHARALAEADYQARRQRWIRACERRNWHSCDSCNADFLPRRDRMRVAKECPNNLAAWWCRHYGNAHPTPPED